jgi:hypothetical protein
MPARPQHRLAPRRQLEQQQQGGGKTAAPVAVAPPITSAPAPAVAAPATASSAEVVQAQQDTRRQALKKKGFSRTVFAGDTGGWYAGNTTPGPANPQVNPTGGSGPGAKTLGS